MQADPSTSSDEIDLGQLIQLIKKGFNSIFRAILRVFRFLKKNAIKLSALILIGAGIGFLLNTLVDDKLKTDVIVKPNFESKDYLYDVVEQLQSNIFARDTAFFKEIEIDVNDLRNFRMEIKAIETKDEVDKEMAEEENKYLEILQNYKDNDFVLDIVKSEILKKSVTTHRITFTHKNQSNGEEIVGKILDYINSNPYFKKIQEVNTANAASRIEENKNLIKQIDGLIDNFSEGLKSNQGDKGMLIDSENGTDISNLLGLKNHLIKEIGMKKIELAEEENAITILNLGKTHPVEKPFFGKNIVMVPTLLIGLFFLISLITYLNRKSIELQ